MTEDGIRQVSEHIDFVDVKGAEDMVDELFPLVSEDDNLVLFDVPCDFNDKKGMWEPVWIPNLPKDTFVKGTHIQTNFGGKKPHKLKKYVRLIMNAVQKEKPIKPTWMKFGHRIWHRYAIKDCPVHVMDEVMNNLDIKHGDKKTAVFIWNNTMNNHRRKWMIKNRPKPNEE